MYMRTGGGVVGSAAIKTALDGVGFRFERRPSAPAGAIHADATRGIT
jgi:hypothetical protein